MMRRLSVLIILVLGAVSTQADYVYLKDGREVFCQVVRETTATVEVKIERIPATFPKEMVERVERTGSLPLMEKLKDEWRFENFNVEPGSAIKCRGVRTPAVDRVIVKVEGRTFPVRLLGVRPFPHDESERRQVAHLLTNQYLVVVLDDEVFDASKTVQGYVYVNTGPEFGQMINETILRRGLADFEAPTFVMKNQRVLQNAVEEARRKRVGRWEQLLPANPRIVTDNDQDSGLHPSLYDNVTSQEVAPGLGGAAPGANDRPMVAPSEAAY